MPRNTTRGESIRLYYYTGRRWGLKALWEKRLKIARYSELNDPFELLPFDVEKRKSRAFWQEQATKLLCGTHGVLCLSEDWRSNVMWSHYGEKHTGLCLGFDVPRSAAVKIRYVDALKPDPLKPGLGNKRIPDSVLEDSLQFKQRAWKYEKEWRLRVPLTTPVDRVSYHRFDDTLHLREVILGARSPMRPIDVLEAVVNPPLDVEIFQARAAFGRFEICRHELIDTHTRKGFRAALALARDVFADELPDD